MYRADGTTWRAGIARHQAEIKTLLGQGVNNHILAGSTFPLARDVAFRLDNLDGEFAVLLMNERVVRICQDDMAPKLMQPVNLGGKLNVVFLVKLLLGVAFEVCIRRHRQVRWVKEYEVARFGVFPQDGFVIAVQNGVLAQ
jgi:hypothetical protein